MKVIVGLGNPGERYANTYHNLGFIVADALAEKLKAKFSLKTRLKCLLATVKKGDEQFLVVKPLTYMNLSGEAVGAVARYYKVEPKDILVVYDDLDLDTGALRLREKGSAGTHNGMKSIVGVIGEDFPRLRIGTKKDSPADTIDYVLSAIPEEKHTAFKEAVDRAMECASEFALGVSFDRLMQKYNGKKSG